ncbi:MAG: hypothetical protein LBS21_05635 [Clostridiales bacterium]|jgi:hypothetical protein|nr:hypothetical protein [Clostridiales bacterium]
MSEKEINLIEKYAAQKGFVIKEVIILKDAAMHIKVRKMNAEAVGAWETEFTFADFAEFKKKIALKTKHVRKNGQAYEKNIRKKETVALRKIEKYKKSSDRAKDIHVKYAEVFRGVFEQIQKGLETGEGAGAEFLEIFSQQYLAEFNKILPYHHNISRKANLHELTKSYKDAVKNRLFKYLASHIKAYKANPDNEYKSRILVSESVHGGAVILQKGYKINYKKLRRNFMRMAAKAVQFTKSFGASYKTVHDRVFFSNYISESKPTCREDMGYTQFKNLVLLCINKNITDGVNPNKKALLLLPVSMLGFGVKTGSDNFFRRENPIKPETDYPELFENPERIPPENAKGTGGSLNSGSFFLKASAKVAPFAAAAVLVFTASAPIGEAAQNGGISPQNYIAAGEPGFGLDFLPFGLGDFLEDEIDKIAASEALKHEQNGDGGENAASEKNENAETGVSGGAGVSDSPGGGAGSGGGESGSIGGSSPGSGGTGESDTPDGGASSVGGEQGVASGSNSNPQEANPQDGESSSSNNNPAQTDAGSKANEEPNESLGNAQNNNSPNENAGEKPGEAQANAQENSPANTPGDPPANAQEPPQANAPGNTPTQSKPPVDFVNADTRFNPQVPQTPENMEQLLNSNYKRVPQWQMPDNLPIYDDTYKGNPKTGY